MPITFDCTCGRHFSVGDAFAGKRTKCPSCGTPLTVPVPEAAPPEPGFAEDEAYRALLGSPDPEPSKVPAWTAAPVRESAEPERSQKTAPKIKAREPVRSPNYDSYPEYAPEPRRPAIHISPAVLGGVGSMILAVVWFGLGWAAGRIYFYPPILFLFGLVAVVRGVLGYSED